MRPGLAPWLVVATLISALNTATSYACIPAAPVQAYPPEKLLADPNMRTVFVGTIVGSGRLRVLETFKGEAEGIVEAQYSNLFPVMCGLKPFEVDHRVVAVLIAVPELIPPGNIWWLSHLEPGDPYLERLRAAKAAGQSNNSVEGDAREDRVRTSPKR